MGGMKNLSYSYVAPHHVRLTQCSTGVILNEGDAVELTNKGDELISVYRHVQTGEHLTETYEIGRLWPGKSGKF